MNRLNVVGTVKDKIVAEVPSKAIGKPSRKEVRITLDILEVDGQKTSQLDYPVFAASEEILASIKIGDRVKVICTSGTGRQIQEISVLAE